MSIYGYGAEKHIRMEREAAWEQGREEGMEQEGEKFMKGLEMKKIEEELQEHIARGDYEEAERILQGYLAEEQAVYNDILAIFDAGIGEYYGDETRRWEAIRRGLCINPRNYELYVMLGNYYLDKNPEQSWLCYENALFYCDDEEDQPQIEGLMQQLLEEYGVSVRKTAIVILSWNLLEYTRLCIESIRQTVPESARQIIVVDNASEDGSVEWLREQTDILLIENQENRGFPAGCNQGIIASDADADIFLLNNDTVLPENALFWLRMGLYSDERNGAAGSVSNYVRNNQRAEGVQADGTMPALFAYAEKTNVPMQYPCEKKLYLVGFALLIRRSVLDRVGMLDERFSPGNFEDNDYGLRILEAGYYNVLCKNSFIIHFGSESFGKKEKALKSILEMNGRKLNEKWGFSLQYYLYPRSELADQIEAPREKAFRLLDVGCGCGAFMGHVQGRYPNASVYGIELFPKAAGFAGTMGEVICGDVEHMEFPWPEEFFDHMVFGDILEHLDDPQTVLVRLSRHLKRGGHIIVSMPNVRHYSVMIPLLCEDRFTYGDAGILDRTHRKLYTGKEIMELVARSGYQVEKMLGITRGETGEQRRKLEEFLSGMKLPDIQSFFHYQYLVKAVKE